MLVIANKNTIVKVIFITLLIIVIMTPIGYVQINKIVYANRVTEYLLEEKQFGKEEIKSVKGVWGKKLPSFYALVTFKDEPYVEYIYFAHNEVKQFGYQLTEEAKEAGVTESDLKHFEPFE